MTLLLRPVFVGLTPPPASVVAETSSAVATSSSNPPRNGLDTLASARFDNEISKGSNVGPQGDRTPGALIENASGTTPTLDEDRLHSMWRVATKVKSVMADGARFENLTWRAWYRKNQLEKIERERQQAMTMMSGCRMGELSEPTAAPFIVGSQATAIPGRSLSIKTPVYGSGYSTILAEIQEASTRRTPTLMPGVSPADSSIGSQSYSKQESSITATVDASSAETSSEAFAVPAHSNTSTSTTTISSNKSLRRRKKNVDKFIKRQQLQQQRLQSGQALQQQPLECICEETGTPIVPVASGIHTTIMDAKNALEGATKPSRPRGKTEETSSFTTNDTISGGSLGDTGEGQSVLRSKGEGLTFSLRRSSHVSCRGSSPSSGERPNVSLLTMLLNRGSVQDSRRSESCPPPVLSMSPPMRPGAPVPLEATLDDGDSSLKTAALSRRPSSNIPHDCMATPPGPPVAITEGGIPGMGGLGNAGRRRPAPKTADFTTPLFIW